MALVYLPIAFCGFACLLLAYIQWIRPEGYLRAWTWFWLLWVVRLLLLQGRSAPEIGGSWGDAVALLAGLGALAALFVGAGRLHRVRSWWTHWAWALFTAAGAGTVLGAAGHYPWVRPLVQLLGAVLLAGMAGLLVWYGGLGERVLATVAVLWMLSFVPEFKIPQAGLAELMPGLCAVAMLVVAFEHEREATERNLRELAVLDLDEPSRVDSSDREETERILQAALQRLSRVLPNHPALLWAGRGAATPVLAGRGFSPAVVEYIAAHASHAVMATLERLGGSAHGSCGRDLFEPDRLAGEPAFVDLRQRLARDGARGYSCVLLKAKAQNLGFLLVARRRWLDLRAGERRIIRALAGQTAIGLDNLHLFRQSMRRSREFEILTQIGTALSTALDADALLRVIHTQLQKLVDVRNCYVAFQDLDRDEIRFALEVENGMVLAPRRRPRTNALSEHVIASGLPLLIGHDVEMYSRQHGMTSSGRSAKNWMGAPIILKGRPEGVIAVQNYTREDAFDAEHLHVLEIVASQAGVALENARLFDAAQRDAAQKTFLNHIARLTISSLRPQQVLNTVVEELATAFAYDHIAIGLVAASGPGLEIRARGGAHGDGAGAGSEALPPETAAQGLMMRAAETRALASAEAGRAGAPRLTACSRSGLAIPILYGDKLLGVLGLENHERGGIDAGQILVLSTLCDQIAVALNQATVFQQMQHQAITDSLTGLKTRRFFMEALEAEWRRASRAGECFAILLLDLNGFKLINDTLGHLEGDRVLARVARVLEQKCRASSVVARMGGDEFTILVPASGCAEALDRSLTHRLQEAMRLDPVLSERGVRASFGMATFPHAGATPEELLHAADGDMYAQKGTAARVAVGS